MSQFLSLITADASLVCCELERVRAVFAPGAHEVVGVGAWQDGQIVQRSAAAGASRQAVWEPPASPVVVLASRALAVGQGLETDAQPFRFRRWLFAASGALTRADQVRARVRETLPEFLAGAVRGATWEVAAFARFLTELRALGRMEDERLEAATAAGCLAAAAKVVEEVSAAVGVAERPVFSLCASNGRTLVAVARGAPLSYALLEGQAACARHGLTDDARAVEPLVQDHLRRRSVVVTSQQSPGPGWLRLAGDATLAVDLRLAVTVR